MDLYPLIYGATYEKDYDVIYIPPLQKNIQDSIIKTIKNGLDGLNGEYNRRSVKDVVWLNCSISGVRVIGVYCAGGYVTKKVEQDRQGRDLFYFLGYIMDKTPTQPIPKAFELFSCLYKYIENRNTISFEQFNSGLGKVTYVRTADQIHLFQTAMGINIYVATNVTPKLQPSSVNYNLYDSSYDDYIWYNSFSDYRPGQDFAICLNVQREVYAVDFLETGMFNTVSCLEVQKPEKVSIKKPKPESKPAEKDSIPHSINQESSDNRRYDRKAVIKRITNSLYTFSDDILAKIEGFIKFITGGSSTSTQSPSIKDMSKFVSEIDANVDKQIQELEKNLPIDKRKK